MPTYSYECTKGHQFDAVQRMTDPPLKRCRMCRSKVQRLIVASTFILKGSGWYSDGYSARSQGSTDSSSNTSESSSKSSTSKESTSTSSDKGSSSSTPAAAAS